MVNLTSLVRRVGFFCALLLTIVASASLEAAEKTISVKQLPKKVRAAVGRLDGKISKIEMETKKGKTLYDIELKVEGGLVELTFTPQAVLVAVEVSPENGDDDEEEDDDGRPSNQRGKGKKNSSDDDDGDDDDGDDDDGNDDDGNDDDGNDDDEDDDDEDDDDD